MYILIHDESEGGQALSMHIRRSIDCQVFSRTFPPHGVPHIVWPGCVVLGYLGALQCLVVTVHEHGPQCTSIVGQSCHRVDRISREIVSNFNRNCVQLQDKLGLSSTPFF